PAVVFGPGVEVLRLVEPPPDQLAFESAYPETQRAGAAEEEVGDAGRSAAHHEWVPPRGAPPEVLVRDADGDGEEIETEVALAEVDEPDRLIAGAPRPVDRAGMAAIDVVRIPWSWLCGNDVEGAVLLVDECWRGGGGECSPAQRDATPELRREPATRPERAVVAVAWIFRVVMR